MDRKLIGTSHTQIVLRGLKKPGSTKVKAEFELFMVAPDDDQTVSGAVRIEINKLDRTKITGYDLNTNSAEPEITSHGDFVFSRAVHWAERSTLYDTPNPFLVLTLDDERSYKPVPELDPELLPLIWLLLSAVNSRLAREQSEASRFFLETMSRRIDGLIVRLITQRDRLIGDGTPLTPLPDDSDRGSLEDLMTGLGPVKKGGNYAVFGVSSADDGTEDKPQPTTVSQEED